MQHIGKDAHEPVQILDAHIFSVTKRSAETIKEEGKESLVFQINYEASKPLEKWTWSTTSWSSTETPENNDAKKVDDPDTSEFCLEAGDILDRDALIFTKGCDIDAVKKLWDCKSQLDYWFDNNKEGLYAEARKRIFPEDKKELKLFHNRQGLKLKEIVNNFSIIKRLLSNTRSNVIDILGSVHTWPECIFGCLRQLQTQGTTIPMNKIRIYGIVNERNSLHKNSVDHRNTKQRPHLTPGDYVVIPDLNIKGDVIEPNHFQKIMAYLKEQNAYPAHLALTDGSVLVGRDPETKQHLENYHELFNSRCLLSQVVLALNILKAEGDLIVKTFDMFSTFSISLLYILRHLFEVVQIEKPVRSRPVNSERYIVCLTKRQDENGLTEMLLNIYNAWSNNAAYSKFKYPITLVPDLILSNDKIFIASAKAMITRLCNRQIQALNSVNEECLRMQDEQKMKENELIERKANEMKINNEAKKDMHHGVEKKNYMTPRYLPGYSNEDPVYAQRAQMRHYDQARSSVHTHSAERAGKYHCLTSGTHSNPRYQTNIQTSAKDLTDLFSAIGVNDVTFSPSALQQLPSNQDRMQHYGGRSHHTMLYSKQRQNMPHFPMDHRVGYSKPNMRDKKFHHQSHSDKNVTQAVTN